MTVVIEAAARGGGGGGKVRGEAATRGGGGVAEEVDSDVEKKGDEAKLGAGRGAFWLGEGVGGARWSMVSMRRLT
jgi:hypothetical protein